MVSAMCTHICTCMEVPRQTLAPSPHVACKLAQLVDVPCLFIAHKEARISTVQCTCHHVCLYVCTCIYMYMYMYVWCVRILRPGT